ncbi:hypothetical protein C8J31_105134 [Rhizobium sp. PP-CC-2G-626]|nr:hypothetical protein C8J31_105134 [Rhizobium sp. PP-CC-2G-626]
MTNEKPTLGDIHVTMRDGNTIGDIGHKITYHSPPPSPNAIMQEGKSVGEFVGDPVSQGDALIFPKLAFEAGGEPDQDFSIQGVRLRLVNYDVSNHVQFGLVNSRVFQRAVCRVLA